MKKVFTLALILFSALTATAQTGSISGKLKDSATGKGLGYATVTVFKAKDTAIVTYRLSNPDGDFKVGGLPLDFPLRAIITFSGYQAFRKEFTLSATSPNLVIDSVMLTTTSHQLDEVIVISERPPVSIKNDTIEFNATAFKTLPNALVEDLLKKLPGVQVDADGNITVNGKPVNRILVDGKTFFGNDPKMATRNLPANVIDKVQVVDDKEQLLANGDDNINNVGKVVNITLKKGVKKGWFGKVYAGAGSDNRFEGGGIANIFRDTLQISLLGYANNLNKPGFGMSDLMQAGGLDRTNSNLNNRSSSIWSSGAGSGISINGINFGGMQGNTGGVATSRGVGFNLNHAPNAKKSLFAQYFYGNVLVDRRNENDSKQYTGDTIIHNNSILTGDVISHAHNIGIGGKFKPDSVTTINFSANYMIGLQDEDRFSNIYSESNKLGALSNGQIMQNNLSNTYVYRHNLVYTHLSKKKAGRRLNIFHAVDVNNRFNDYSTNSLLHYTYPSPYDSALNQLRQEGVPRTDVTTIFNYSEPLSKMFTIRLSGIHSYSKLSNDITTFNPGANLKYDVVNSTLTSNFSRENTRGYFTFGFEYRKKNLTITPQLRYLAQNVNNVLASLPAAIKQKTSDVLPGLSITYKQMNFNYSKDIALPSYAFLIPVVDNTNPYFISKGNPNLVPTERHNLSVNYYFNNPKKNLNIGLNANGGFAYNDFVNTITVDNKGVQTSYPINADGSVNYGINYNINRQYKNNPKFIFNWNTGAWYGFNRGRLVFNGESSFQKSYNMQQWAGFGFNFNDKVELNNNASAGLYFTDYTSKQFKKLEVWSYNFGSELIVRVPKHVIWESSFNYINTGSTVPGMPKDFVRWNAAINFTMLKDEKGVLRISVFDLLNTGNQVSSSATRNMINIYKTNVLGRYVMATFTYNIRAIGGAKKKVGGERLFLF